MKKYGEIIFSSGKDVIIRVYKAKGDEGFPTAFTVSATSPFSCTVGNFVSFDMNVALFSLSTLSGYILPFIFSIGVYFFVSLFTSNLLIIQPLFLASLALCYILSVRISKLDFFKSITLCTVTEIIEE